MHPHSRREFLADIGRGMMVASVGTSLVTELGLGTAIASEVDGTLTFGPLEPLVAMMQETPVGRLQPLLVDKLNAGTELQTLVSAAALANARSFGGQHYVGYHTLMALMPAWEMSRLLPERSRALPVLKVLYRNTDTIQKNGGRSNEMLRKMRRIHGEEEASGERLQEHLRKRDMAGAERTFAKSYAKGAEAAYNDLQYIVQDEIDVHQIVLAWRAWDTLQLTGMEHAHTMLRQSVRHCIDREQIRVDRGRPEPRIRKVLPKVLDQHRLLSRPVGTRNADDEWVDKLSFVIFRGSREEAADAVGAALAEGFSPEVVGEAISLAANRLLLHDPGRRSDDGTQKPKGSVHGASVGVHASDSANAWRHVARVTNHRNKVASLIVGAYHTAGQQKYVRDERFPFSDPAGEVRATDADTLLKQIDACVRDKNQARVSTLADCYGRNGHSPKPLFDLLLKYAVSEDGALHAEKYYHTVREEFASTRPAFRWRHLTALARVTASEYGYAAPGREQARSLLGIS